ncbi:MAG: hypothetical protein IPI91_13680 [Flavobacteriales bacterium]|nr:hypothetical protein [Flavobacteriales bacterium]
MKTILAILTSLIFVSCAQKNSAPLEVEKEKETAPTEIHEKNRTIGVIQQAITKEGCAWTIRIKEVDYLLDPTISEKNSWSTSFVYALITCHYAWSIDARKQTPSKCYRW